MLLNTKTTLHNNFSFECDRAYHKPFVKQIDTSFCLISSPEFLEFGVVCFRFCHRHYTWRRFFWCALGFGNEHCLMLGLTPLPIKSGTKNTHTTTTTKQTNKFKQNQTKNKKNKKNPNSSDTVGIYYRSYRHVHVHSIIYVYSITYPLSHSQHTRMITLVYTSIILVYRSTLASYWYCS